MTKLLVSMAAVVILASAPAFAAKSAPATFQEGGKTFKGELFAPDHAKGALPLVLVVHEWWGKNGYPEKRAKMIADELGYAALAVDLYGDGKTLDNPKDAGETAGAFYQDPALGVARLQKFAAAAPEAAKALGAKIDSGKVAAIGYCFGGAQVLNLARSGGLSGGETLLGVVSFHGSLGSSVQDTDPILPKLLVLHGADDKFVKPEEVAKFKDEMKKHHAKMSFIAYPGATHAFTNPDSTEAGKKFGIPIAYNEKADKGSWHEMQKFLKGLFKK